MKIKGLFNVLNILFKPSDNDSSPKYSENSSKGTTEDGKKVYWNEFSIRNIEWFLTLTKDNVIEQFLEYDNCFKLADKYLLAMVFTYFIRANLPHSEYNRDNFFAALYLAHDMEEDDEELKVKIMRWGLGRSHKGEVEYFLQLRDNLWTSMNYRACVSLQTCLQVMQSSPDCNLWQRERSTAHSGAIRYYEETEECDHCQVSHVRFYGTDVESEESDTSDLEGWEMGSATKKIKLTEE